MKYYIKLLVQPIFHWSCLGFLGSTGKQRQGLCVTCVLWDPVIQWAGCCSQLAEICWRMPNSTRLWASVDMPGHLGHVKLLCVGSPAAGPHGSPGDKKAPPAFVCALFFLVPLPRGTVGWGMQDRKVSQGALRQWPCSVPWEPAGCISGVPWEMANVIVRPLPLS